MNRNFVYISEEVDAYLNMARDEWFLDHVQADSMILHLYCNENAVIIGKNQNPWVECNLSNMEKDGVRLARRVSGGGAVYHDGGNLNFSFICGEDRGDKEACLQLIETALKSLGISCDRSGRNDMLRQGKKFSGNATAFRKGKMLFHGTLLISSDLEKLGAYLTVDPQKIQSKGISSVRSRVCNLTEAVPELTLKGAQKAILCALAQRDGYYGEWSFSASEAEEVAQYHSRHRSEAWRLGETPRFDYQWKKRFPWGGVQLLFSFEKGKIAKLSAFSDAMDPDFCHRLEAALTGIPFRDEDILLALKKDPSPEFSDLATCSFIPL
ncbi:MAG: lipoate--protein ligase [Clostridia bacterium]|nr:lipoate--protein ligase [Clostridia bacterium]